MDFKQLEAFVKVVKLSSFSKAAEALYLSQPSISAYVHALERELDCQLLFRTTKEVFPTQAGYLLFEYAQNLLSLRQGAILNIRHMSTAATIGGEIELISSSVPAQYLLPEIIAAFSAQYPEVTFKLIQGDSKAVIQAVASQQYPLGITGLGIQEPKCSFHHLGSDRLVLITPLTVDPVDLAEPVNLQKLLQQKRFVFRESGSGTAWAVLSYLESLGLSLKQLDVVACFSNTQAVVLAVTKGLGISIVSKIATESGCHKSKLRVVELDSPHLQRQFYFVTRKGVKLAPTEEAFMEFARSYCLKLLA